MRLTQETVRRHFAESTTKYGTLFKKMAEETPSRDIEMEKGRDDLAAWLQDLRLECDEGDCAGHDHGTEHTHSHGEQRPNVDSKYVSNPKISGNMVALHRCSYCGNPSAVLKKCSGCERSRFEFPFVSRLNLCTNSGPPDRYCDALCQKAHWPEHKRPCKASKSSNDQGDNQAKEASSFGAKDGESTPLPTAPAAHCPTVGHALIPSSNLDSLD